MKAARLVVLTVALAAGGVAAMLAGRTGKHPAPKAPVANVATVDILVARSDIDVGKRLSPADVAWQAWPANANTGNFIRRNQHPNAIEGLTGSIARTPFVAGEPIRQAKLVQAKGSGYMAAILPSGMRAVSIGVSPESGASGFILPNDHVDIVLTRRDRAAEKATGSQAYTSQTILSDVRVLAIDQNVTEKDGQKVVIGKTATLELTPKQVETVELARQTGSLSLALRSIVDIGKQTPKAEDDDRQEQGAVNVVRFGVTTTTTPR
jgi:pilus assembly protein CpaB